MSSNAALDAEIIRLDSNALGTFTALDLQRMEFPPIQYVVPNYVVEGLTLLAGKPKIGKSWLVLDWALAVAYGGIATGSIQCEWGEVLYCALEDNKRRLYRRLQQLLPDPGSEWPGRLELLTSLKRLHEGGLDDIERWVDRAERPRLVVLDTFACVRPPRRTQDSSYDADYAALGPLQKLASALNIAIVAVHHVRKLESDDPLDSVSGTTGLTGAVDSVLVLNRDSQGTTLYGRGRDIEEIETAVDFDQSTGRWSILGDASEVRRSDERKAIIDAIAAAKDPIGPLDIAIATGQKCPNVRYLLGRMAESGEVKKVSRGAYALP